jgi:two-component system, response regulator, stage 0 sporulation protein F
VPAAAVGIPFYFSPPQLKGGLEMKNPPTTIRGLINDLTRTLTCSLVHMDDLLLHLNNDSGEFDDAWLANHQLERALEFFIELRSEYMIRQESIPHKRTKTYEFNAVEKLLHNFNNLLAVIIGYCDLIQYGFADVRQICQTTEHIYRSIQNLYCLLNEIICLPEHSVSSKLNLSCGKGNIAKTKSCKKSNLNNILLVEDDEGMKEIISTVLHKHEYIVFPCSKGKEALSIFKKYKADFVICIVDVGLPDIKGPDLVKILLSDEPNINVIFTSGYNETILKQQFDLIGPHPILIKPFQLAELLNKMESIIIH